jgi:hypothetical protein
MEIIQKHLINGNINESTHERLAGFIGKINSTNENSYTRKNIENFIKNALFKNNSSPVNGGTVRHLKKVERDSRSNIVKSSL